MGRTVDVCLCYLSERKNQSSFTAYIVPEDGVDLPAGGGTV